MTATAAPLAPPRPTLPDARTHAAEARRLARARAATPFYEIYQAERRIAAMEETRRVLSGFRVVARGMFAAGTGRRGDVLRAGTEVGRMDGELERMHGLRQAAVRRLNALLGRDSAEPAPNVALPALTLPLPAAEILAGWARSAPVSALRARMSALGEGRRDRAATPELWPESGPGRRWLGLEEEVAELRDELASARVLLERHRTEELPGAEALVRAALGAYRAGAIDFAALLEAQASHHRCRERAIALRASYGRALVELEMLIGRSLERPWPHQVDSAPRADAAAHSP